MEEEKVGNKKRIKLAICLLKPMSTVVAISHDHQRIQHLQPLESWGPSNHRSHKGFKGPIVDGSNGSGLVSTLLSISLHGVDALSIFSSCSSSSSKNLASCSNRFSSACNLCFPLVSAEDKDCIFMDSGPPDCIFLGGKGKSLACTQLMNHKAYEIEVINCKDSIFKEKRDDPEIFMDPIKCWP